uniref:Uncharacterized protein n=1 Tax=Symphyocladiella dendroidea TaxID=2506487 RepID=A0A1Z1M7K5_9FLOR|nr:hypothetical protein [Symphyocladiella dendroidea]ARW61959.1 hypothetical protein [Symphyocladiella dendroidea]
MFILLSLLYSIITNFPKVSFYFFRPSSHKLVISVSTKVFLL